MFHVAPVNHAIKSSIFFQLFEVIEFKGGDNSL